MNAAVRHRATSAARSRARPRSYDAAAALQHEVEARLLESLDYLDDPKLALPPPQTVLDLGCGPGRAARRDAQALAEGARARARPRPADAARSAASAAGWSLRSPFDRVCADARALPLAEGSVDVLFSNLCLQWVEDLPAVFAGFRRVLKPGGLLLVSTFGPDTLYELRDAFAAGRRRAACQPVRLDRAVRRRADARRLPQPGARSRRCTATRYADLPALMRELRAIGATNALRIAPPHAHRQARASPRAARRLRSRAPQRRHAARDAGK